MRIRLSSAMSVIMIAAMVYAAAGPQVCRALMASGDAPSTVRCCGDGAEPHSREGAPADPHQSCPLHKLSLIELLPAAQGQSLPEPPQAPMDASPAFSPDLNLLNLSPSWIVSTDAGPPRPHTRSLYLVHQNIRR